MLKSLADRIEALPENEREHALRALDQRLAEIEQAKRESLRHDLDVGIEQARDGQTVDGLKAFARIKHRFAL